MRVYVCAHDCVSVGGSYIMGTAETVYFPSQGLIWALGRLAYLITSLLGKKHKESLSARYLTMMDRFQRRYGNSFTTALLLPALISDVLWVASILAALAVTITYTVLGGLYTDFIQLFFIFISLQAPWMGELKLEDAGKWIDELSRLCLSTGV
ncbi:unnamed protein product [Coregonus sp. 'balchen']|nr:unnamed protein product [Coregonus sp. 'balchen']